MKVDVIRLIMKVINGSLGSFFKGKIVVSDTNSLPCTLSLCDSNIGGSNKVDE